MYIYFRVCTRARAFCLKSLIQMDARHSKTVRQVENFLQHELVVSAIVCMWPYICVIYFIIWVMYTYIILDGLRSFWLNVLQHSATELCVILNTS